MTFTPDWWQIVIGLGTLLAAVLAVVVSMRTSRQQVQLGERLGMIEMREHDWMERDRRAAIEVSRRSVYEGDTRTHLLRLRNIGKEAAHDVSWTVETTDESDQNIIEAWAPEIFSVIHPGEYIASTAEHVGVWQSRGPIVDKGWLPA